MNVTPYHVSVIKSGLTTKQRVNPQYSLRAYARDLGMHHATLSQVLKGQRPLPLKNSKQVADKLNLTPKEQTLFFESLYRSKTQLDQIQIDHNTTHYMLDEAHYKIIAEWEHFAVLSLFDFNHFTVNAETISQKLGVTTMRAEQVLEHLIAAHLVSEDEMGRLKCTYKNVRTTEDIQSRALQASHRESLAMAHKKLERVDLHLRDFSSLTVAVDTSKIGEAKTIIREFRRKMEALLSAGQKTEVYQLAIQFYPLTKKENL